MDSFTKKFISDHQISEKILVNANGKTVNSIKYWMKENEIFFVYNTTPCKNGHNIRSRSGHCIVCDVTRIAFVKRSFKNGHLYLFGSKSKQFIKLGMTTENIEDRLQKLNSRGVGGVNDWVVLLSFKVDNTNLHEFNLHKILSPYQVKKSYYQETESKEIFRCSYSKILEKINSYQLENNLKIKEYKEWLKDYGDYNFKNLRNI